LDPLQDTRRLFGDRETSLEIVICQFTQQPDILATGLAPGSQQRIIRLLKKLALLLFGFLNCERLDVFPLHPAFFSRRLDVLPEFLGRVHAIDLNRIIGLELAYKP